MLICTTIQTMHTQIVQHINQLVHRIGGKYDFKELKVYSLPIGVFLALSVISVTLFRDFQNILNVVKGPFGFLFIKEAAKANLWPNVYTTVAELNAASTQAIISQIGGMLMLTVSAIGILYVLYLAYKKESISPALAILLAIWFIGTAFAARKGVRFVLLMVPAFSVALGIGVSAIHRVFTDMLSTMFHISKKFVKPVIFLGLLLLLVSPYQVAGRTATGEVPSMTDVWWRSLEHIRDNSAENAIITSWWDFGHWFKAVSDRAVTFDGASQNTPQAHWAGKSLLSNSEKQSVGILRMLDCGANTAFDELQEQNDEDTVESIDTLYAIFELDTDGARTELTSRGYDAEKVLPLTHCTPPEAFYITSEDMVSKSGVWAHFGSWNFTRSKIVVDTAGKSEAEALKIIQDLGFDEEQAKKMQSEIRGKPADQLNNWIAPWPGYIQVQPQQYVMNCKDKGDGILCERGQTRMAVNLTNMDARISTNAGLLPPKRFVYWDGSDDMAVKEYNESTGTSAALIPRGDGYQAVMMADELALGTFTRLFYLEGHGMEHFDKVFDQVTVNGWRVIVWKIDWEGGEKLTPFIPEVESVTNSTSTTA